MAAQVPFALSPALVTNEVIDYSTSVGQKLYNAAVESLQDPYDGSEDGLHIFLEQLKTRAECMGWMTILDVPPDLAQPDEVINIISDYGQLSLQQIRDHATTYVQQQVRAAQDSAQLYQCLMHTLTKEAHANITLLQQDYFIDNAASGVLLLKVIISEAHVDTNATERLI